jgi:hypothetical protein
MVEASPALPMDAVIPSRTRVSANVMEDSALNWM